MTAVLGRPVQIRDRVDLRFGLVRCLGNSSLTQPLLLKDGLGIAQPDRGGPDPGRRQTRLGAALAIAQQHHSDRGNREIPLASGEFLDGVARSRGHCRQPHLVMISSGARLVVSAA